MLVYTRDKPNSACFSCRPRFNGHDALASAARITSIGPACVRHPVLHVQQSTRTYTHLRASGITLGQHVVWFNPLSSRYLYYTALHPNAPHLCHPRHVNDTRPANASHQKRGVDVTAKLAGQVTMSPDCYTIIWGEKRNVTGKSMQWWSENVCWHVSDPCMQQPSD